MKELQAKLELARLRLDAIIDDMEHKTVAVSNLLASQNGMARNLSEIALLHTKHTLEVARVLRMVLVASQEEV